MRPSRSRTWLFQIALDQARTRGDRERRTVPFASLAEREVAGDAHAVDSAETLARVREAIERLPPAQRVVITLRDVYGCESDEPPPRVRAGAVSGRVADLAFTGPRAPGMIAAA